jgi:hypothetical protein
LADRAGSDGGLDDIGNVNSALSRGGKGNGARLSTGLSISDGGAAVVVRAGNTSGQGTRCGTSGQGSRGHASGVGGRNDADSGLQAGGDAGDLEVVLVLAKHVEVVAGSLVSGGAGQAGVKSSGAWVAAWGVLAITLGEGVVAGLASLSSTGAVKGLVVNEAGSEVSETSVVNTLALRRGRRVGAAATARVEQLRASVLAVCVQLLAFVVGDQGTGSMAGSVSCDAVDVGSGFLGLDACSKAVLVTLLASGLDRCVTAGETDIIHARALGLADSSGSRAVVRSVTGKEASSSVLDTVDGGDGRDLEASEALAVVGRTGSLDAGGVTAASAGVHGTAAGGLADSVLGVTLSVGVLSGSVACLSTRDTVDGGRNQLGAAEARFVLGVAVGYNTGVSTAATGGSCSGALVLALSVHVVADAVILAVEVALLDVGNAVEGRGSRVGARSAVRVEWQAAGLDALITTCLAGGCEVRALRLAGSEIRVLSVVAGSCVEVRGLAVGDTAWSQSGKVLCAKTARVPRQSSCVVRSVSATGKNVITSSAEVLALSVDNLSILVRWALLDSSVNLGNTVNITGGDLAEKAVFVWLLALRIITAGHACILEDTTGLFACGGLCGGSVVFSILGVGLLCLGEARWGRGGSVVGTKAGTVALLADLADTVLLAQIKDCWTCVLAISDLRITTVGQIVRGRSVAGDDLGQAGTFHGACGSNTAVETRVANVLRGSTGVAVATAGWALVGARGSLGWADIVVREVEVVARSVGGDTVRSNVVCNGNRCKANEGRDEGSHNECEPNSRQKLILTKDRPVGSTGKIVEQKEEERDKR